MSSPSSQTIGSSRVVAVVVPGPGRGDDEIARLHRGALAVDRGIGAVPLDDEAQRRLRVAMRRRDLARHDQLQPGEQRAGDRRLAAEAGVHQHQHAARRLLRGDQAARLHQIRPHVAVMPDRRQAFGVAARRSPGCAAAPTAAPGWPARSGRRTPAARGCGPGACSPLAMRRCSHASVFRRGLRAAARSPRLKPILARSAISAADCASVSALHRRAHRGPVRVVVEMRDDALQRRHHRIFLDRHAHQGDLGLQLRRPAASASSRRPCGCPAR